MNVAALFYKIGYHSIVVGRGNTKRFQYNDFSFGKFVSLKKKKRSITFKILNFIFGFEKFFFARYFFKKHSNVDIIIIGFQLSFLLKRYICKKSKKCGMKVIFSIMEWYNFSQYISKPWFLHKYFSTHKTIKTLKISDGGVLSISTFK